jgi:hypothetical protein
MVRPLQPWLALCPEIVQVRVAMVNLNRTPGSAHPPLELTSRHKN